MGSVLLAVISELQAFNFHDTFTDPFEVGLLHSCCSRSCSVYCASWALGLTMLSAIARAAETAVCTQVGNKVAELVMLSEDREVGGCCVPGDAADR